MSRVLSKRKRKTVQNQTQQSLTYDDFVRMVSQQNDNHSAMNLSGVYTCIDIISNTIAKLPFFIVNNKTKKRKSDADEMYRLLNYQPNSRMNAMVFKKLMMTRLLTTGNSYIKPIWRGTKVVAYEPLQNVSVAKIDNDIVYVVTDSNKNVVEFLRYDEIIHLKMYSEDGVTGISPLKYAKLVTDVGLNQEQFQKSFYENGGRPSGTINVGADLSEEMEITNSDGTKTLKSMKDLVREAWIKHNAGSKNAFNVAVLDNGMEYKEISQISPSDMDFVSSKTVNLEDIARFFNVPAYKLGAGKQTYANNEQSQIDYITNCIVPLVYQIEQEFTLKSILNKDFINGDVIKLNIEAELRGDIATRAAWYDKMRSMGVYSINEIRDKEDMPDIENGDVRLIGANSVPLERLIAGETPSDTTPDITETTEQGDDQQ